MPDQPLFYRSVVPLNRETHRSLRLATAKQPYAFAVGNHLIPAVVDEFAAACASLPILFIPDGKGASPVFLTGLSPGHSSFVDANGQWTGTYIPAYLRRYPFILGEVTGADPLICIDDKSDLLAMKGSDYLRQPLFKADGTDTDLLTERVRLVTDYAAAAKRTQVLCGLIQEIGLLRPVTIERKDPKGSSSALHGLLAIDEPALNALPDEVFLRLRAEGFLSPVYTHLVSLPSTG